MPTRPAKCLLESLVVERLDEIVERGELERLERMAIVRRDEDRRRHRVDADGPNDFEAAHPWHLDVEKDEVWMQRSNRFDRGRPIAGGSYDLHSLFMPKQVFD